MAARLLCVPSLTLDKLSFSSTFSSLQCPAVESPTNNASAPGGLVITCVAQAGGAQPGGTRLIGSKRVKVLQEGDKSAKFRDKVPGEPASVKLLSRIEQLRLLTKAEKAGLLSAAEKAGLSLSMIERLGLLSKAEDLGVLSAVTDPSTPGSLLILALGLLISGPLIVYFVPEDAPWEVVLQFLAAIISVLGGSAAFATSNFVSTLQSSD
eukprot:c47001_g1_i1 orf=471-1097(-)